MTQPQVRYQGLSVLVHGPAKGGKSRFGSSGPAPRLILDAEAGSRFVPGTKVWWDPARSAPPVPDGTWDSCLVAVSEFRQVSQARQWLASGQHPFASVTLDSVSEIQQRCVDQLVGTDQMKTQDWGALLRIVSDEIRKFRDLVMHPVKPLWTVCFICQTAEKGATHAKWRPLVQGQLRDTLPYIPDVCGYLFVNPPMDAAGTWPGNRLLVGPHPDFESGERVNGALGYIVDNPNLTEMLYRVIAMEQGYVTA